MSVLCIFFFKQKTAYEMRISDWSSDVCSSDLSKESLARICGKSSAVPGLLLGARALMLEGSRGELGKRIIDPGDQKLLRSEEHTSELQSLMRISYAVFCLKKKKQRKQQYRNEQRV